MGIAVASIDDCQVYTQIIMAIRDGGKANDPDRRN
jgi:hypothetical protein